MLSGLSLPAVAGLFLAMTLVVVVAGVRLTAIGDLVYRRANLDHAAADVVALDQAGLLLLMLSVPVIAFAAPEVTLFAVHPASVALFVISCYGTRHAAQMRKAPTRHPELTGDTRRGDRETEDETGVETPALVLRFGILAAMPSELRLQRRLVLMWDVSRITV